MDALPSYVEVQVGLVLLRILLRLALVSEWRSRQPDNLFRVETRAGDRFIHVLRLRDTNLNGKIFVSINQFVLNQSLSST